MCVDKEKNDVILELSGMWMYFDFHVVQPC